jgi:hypothetical protein
MMLLLTNPLFINISNVTLFRHCSANIRPQDMSTGQAEIFNEQSYAVGFAHK